MQTLSGPPAVALQRCDTFVGRTMNWLYDHLRHVPRYAPVVLCDRLANRGEFPHVPAWAIARDSLSRRLWRRLSHQRLFPLDQRRIALLQPKVLHSHFGYVAMEDRTLWAHLQVPWIVSFYGADVYMLGREPLWRDRYAWLFQSVDRVLALGPAMAAELEAMGCTPGKIEVHGLGVDVEQIPHRPRELSPGERMEVLFAGTFREKKGIQYLIRALYLSRRSGVRSRLHLVGDVGERQGDAETRDEVFRQIREYDLEECVRHYSWLTFSQLLDLAFRCHVFVAPSVTAADGDAEGTPFVIQQMMATGMPVITTHHSDIPFVFGPHEDLLLPERDAAAIAERLRAYAEEPGRIAADGMALGHHIRSRFDVRACAALLADQYDSVRAARGAGQAVAR